MKKPLSSVGALLLVWPVILAIRTSRFTSRHISVEPAPAIPIDTHGAGERLAAAIRYQTIPEEGAGVRGEEFRALHAWLESTFPRFHAIVSREIVADHSLVHMARP